MSSPAMKKKRTPTTALSEVNRSLIGIWYRDFGREIVARLRKIYGAGPPDADDLAQTAFEKLANFSDLEKIEDPRAFIFRTAVNTALDYQRRDGTRRRMITELTQDAEKAQTLTPENVYLNKEALIHLSELLAELPPIEKELVYRSRFKGETLTVIADELNISISSASRQLAKTLARLHSKFRQSDSVN